MTEPVAQCRGFSYRPDVAGGIVLVRGDIDVVGPPIAALLGGALRRDVYGRRRADGAILLYQYRGHRWTILDYRPATPVWARDLSARLGRRCLYFGYGDASAWSEYGLFQDGQRLEEFQFGPDYCQEMGDDEGLALILGPDPWDVAVSTDGLVPDLCLFRSRIRSATEAEVRDPGALLDRLFREEDAWLPDGDCLPYGKASEDPSPRWNQSLQDYDWEPDRDTYEAERLSGDDFERVDAIVAPGAWDDPPGVRAWPWDDAAPGGTRRGK